MTPLNEVRIGVRPIERFREVLGAEQMDDAMRIAARMRQRLLRRVIWNVNSTAMGGGVAEMLPPLLGYTRAIGIDSRWIVIEGDPDFFGVTKRLHHALHGSAGDGTPLDAAAREIYEETTRRNAVEFASVVRPGDFVILHDPQTAGLASHLAQAGVHVIWRCHIGHDEPGPEVQEGWEFLRPYLADVPVFVFSRQAYVPEMCDHGKSKIIQPSIDPFTPKNQELSENATRTILVHTGLVEGPPPPEADHSFLRDDGSPSRVHRRADVIRMGRAPAWDAPLVVQVSRWDPLKDPVGVMHGFARAVDGGTVGDAQLVLAGPHAASVADDPEAGVVLDQVEAAWRELPQSVRNRVHLASLPTADVEENAAIVNALQRHATVVVQKSLREGFGLTVTEAMWKGRPVIASAVGGIQDQIEDERTGLLLKDPTSEDEFAAKLRSLLESPERCEALGRAGRERVRSSFLGLGHLIKYAAVMERMIDAEG